MQRIAEELAKLLDFYMYKHMAGHNFSTINLFLKISLPRISNNSLPFLLNRRGIGICRFNAFISGKQNIRVEALKCNFLSWKRVLLADRRQIIMCLISANLASQELYSQAK